MIEIKPTPYQYEMIVSGVEKGTAIRLNAYYMNDVTDFNIYLNITISGAPRMTILVPASLFLSWEEDTVGIKTHYNLELEESTHILKEGNTVKIITEWCDEGSCSIVISLADMVSICKRFKLDREDKEADYWKYSSPSAKFKKLLRNVFNLPRTIISGLITKLN